MKKLFLYMRYVIVMFAISYFGSYVISVNTLGKDTMKNESEDIDNNTTEEVIAVNQPQKNDKYIIVERNGNVVVYYNDYENVYEYTGISINSVKINDKAAYEKIKNNYVLYDEKEVYAFLQSISN